MAGYVIAIIDVTNAENYQEYARQVPATITKYGGRYLVRGGKMELKGRRVARSAHGDPRVPIARAGTRVVRLA